MPNFGERGTKDGIVKYYVNRDFWSGHEERKLCLKTIQIKMYLDTYRH